MRWFFVVAALAALGGAIMAGLAYVAPESGVGGTPGALLCALAALVAAVSCLMSVGGGRHPWAAALAAVGTLLSALAAWFLMQPAAVASLLVALAALVAGVASRPGAPRRRPA